ncbi:MAG: phosphotransacetylase [Proteobacteria bacterium]|nr:MAG: phosphotransacetylase [Pseudomonadota bacterium]
MVVESPFVQKLLEMARAEKGRLALPEGDDPRVIEAAKSLLKADVLSELWLFGKASEIATALANSDKRLKLVEASDETVITQTRNHFEERARAKGKALTAEESAVIGTSVLNQAAMYLAQDKVDAVVAGCAHTTADVIRATLKGVGMKKGLKTLSGSFVMVRGKEIYLYGDCGVVADPTSEQLADIAEATADTFKLLFADSSPKIAFLSFSSKGSADHPRVDKVRDALKIFEARKTGYLADGELQFDAAFVPEIGKRKAPGSLVAGQANCFIFPDLDAGNIGYKITQRLGGFDAYGPILQGGAKPYLDLSRGANAKDIMVSGLLALIKARY